MIWAAYNGFMGNGAICALVEADDEETATALALKTLARDPGGTGKPGYTRIRSIERIELPLVVELDF